MDLAHTRVVQADVETAASISTVDLFHPTIDTSDLPLSLAPGECVQILVQFSLREGANGVALEGAGNGSIACGLGIDPCARLVPRLRAISPMIRYVFDFLFSKMK